MRHAGSIAILLAALAGCSRADEAGHYTAPKDPQWRLLGAIASGPDATWFFKIVAAPETLEPAKGGVIAFLRTLKAENGQVRWTVPPGWHEEKSPPERLATYRIGDRDPRLEMTVTRLSGAGGGLEGNVARWREQIGLEPLGASQLESTIQRIPAVNLEVHLVDLVGPNRPGGMGARPMSAPSEPPAAAPERPVTFELPPGWRENRNPSRSRMMEFTVEDPAGTATVSLTAMEGEAGGVAANIDRWRSQVGLAPLGELAPARSALQITFVGAEAWLAEAIGQTRAILGVIAQTAGGTLFLKFDGPPAVVSAQRGAFIHFAESFKLRGHHD